MACGSQRHRGKNLRSLTLEALECRTVPSASWPGLNAPQAESEPDGSAIFSQSLGDLSSRGQLSVVGRIASLPSGAGQVDWYRFTLDHAAAVKLETLDKGQSPFVSVLSLYDDDVGDYVDTYNPTGYRLISQSDGSLLGGDAQISQTLSPGTYFVAVSGAGNLFFSPIISGSGYEGSTGPYGLLLTAIPLALASSDGPVVVNANPAQGSALAASPFLLRVDFSSAIDPSSLNPGTNIRVLYSAKPFTDPGQTTQIGISGVNLGLGGMELQIAPSAPLVPGYYQIFLAGNTDSTPGVLVGLNHATLGANAGHRHGQDATISFQITGNEGKPGPATSADDTLATAHDLGSIAGSGLVQITGAIGNDSTDSVSFDPSDLNLYHFRVTGSGRFSFQTEVFAGRIGSPLDPEISLYQLNPNGSLSLVGWNDNAGNTTPSDDGAQCPLLVDPNLFAGLGAGDYYLAVYSSNFSPGAPPSLNLRATHSYQGGYSTGPYVLNILVVPDNTPPLVDSVKAVCGGDGGSYSKTLSDGTELSAPPIALQVRFSEEVNLTQSAQNTFSQTSSNLVNDIFIIGPDRTIYHPRFYAYYGDSSNSDFLLYEALPNGTYELHLSGPLGLTDLAGNPLEGNSPGGDYVIHFTVNGPLRGIPADPTYWLDSNPPGQLDDLGTLFADELQQGVTLQRNPTSRIDRTDWVQFAVTQERWYSITLAGNQLPGHTTLTLTDASGVIQASSVTVSRNSEVLFAYLKPGAYRIRVSTSSGSLNAGEFLLTFSIPAAAEPPPPLTIGPAPAIRIRHITEGSTPATPFSPSITPVVFAASQTGLAIASNATPGIPEGILVSLASGPATGDGTFAANGRSGDSSVGQLVFSPTKELILSEALARLPLVVDAPGSGTVDNIGPSGSLASLVSSVLGRVQGISWKSIVDALHLLPSLPEAQFPSSSKSSSEAGQEEQSDDGADDESVEASPVGSTEFEGSDAFDARVLTAFTVLMQLPRDRRPQQNRSHVRLETEAGPGRLDLLP
jgi:hypothetical protein